MEIKGEIEIMIIRQNYLLECENLNCKGNIQQIEIEFEINNDFNCSSDFQVSCPYCGRDLPIMKYLPNKNIHIISYKQ